MNPTGDTPRSPRLSEACAELDRRLRAGQDGRAEALLEAYPDLAARPEAAWELIFTEFAVRRQLGQRPDPDAWLDRFPQWRDDLRQLFALRPLFETPPALPPVGGVANDSRDTPPTVAPPTVPPSDPTGDPPAPGALGDQSTLASRSAVGALPERFGRYRIVRWLGGGGMGSVYKAFDPDLDREVALKVPKLSYADDPLVERFLREARAVAALEHPNVCRIHDIGEIDGVPYLSMAYIDGPPLAERVHKGGPLPQREAAGLVRELAGALAHVHRHGVIHRDLKPGNVMLTPEGRPVLVDFGLAVRLNREDPRLTASGAVVGTPAYLAPEQVESHRGTVGPGCDVYALGVILYELLTARLPFTGSLGEILVQVARDAPPPPSSHRPDLDPALEAICLRAMAKKAQDRYDSMDEMAAALDAYLDGTAPAPGPRRRYALAGLACVAGVGVALGAGLLWPWLGGGTKGDTDRVKDGNGSAAREKGKDSPRPKPLSPVELDAQLGRLREGSPAERAASANQLKQWAAELEGSQLKDAVNALVVRIADERWEGGDRDPSKDAALAALKAMGPERVTEALHQAAQSSRGEVIRWACDRLGDQRGDPVATGALLTRLTHADVKVRAAAARGLGRVGSPTPKVTKALIDRVADPTWQPDNKGTDESKEAALEALMAVATKPVVEAALKAAAEDRSNPEGVRSWARKKRPALRFKGIGRRDAGTHLHARRSAPPPPGT